MKAARVPFVIAIVTTVLPLATAEVQPATLPQTEQNRFEEFYREVISLESSGSLGYGCGPKSDNWGIPVLTGWGCECEISHER